MPVHSRHFLEYERLRVELAELWQNEGGGSDREAAIFDELEQLDEHLSEGETDWLLDISADLFQLNGKERHRMSSEDVRGPRQQILAVLDRFRANQWPELLQLLRLELAGLTEESRAYLRGRAYSSDALGNPYAGSAFYRYAAQRSDQGANYLALSILSLNDQKAEAVRQSEKILAHGEDLSSEVGATVAAALFKGLTDESVKEDRNVRDFDRVIRLSLRAFDQPESVPIDILDLALSTLVESISVQGLDEVRPSTLSERFALGTNVSAESYTRIIALDVSQRVVRGELSSEYAVAAYANEMNNIPLVNELTKDVFWPPQLEVSTSSQLSDARITRELIALAA